MTKLREYSKEMVWSPGASNNMALILCGYAVFYLFKTPRELHWSNNIRRSVMNKSINGLRTRSQWLQKWVNISMQNVRPGCRRGRHSVLATKERSTAIVMCRLYLIKRE